MTYYFSIDVKKYYIMQLRNYGFAQNNGYWYNCVIKSTEAANTAELREET